MWVAALCLLVLAVLLFSRKESLFLTPVFSTNENSTTEANKLGNFNFGYDGIGTSGDDELSSFSSILSYSPADDDDDDDDDDEIEREIEDLVEKLDQFNPQQQAVILACQILLLSSNSVERIRKYLSQQKQMGVDISVFQNLLNILDLQVLNS